VIITFGLDDFFRITRHACGSIQTGDRTLLQYLADPLKDSLARSFIED
jgi:hypothetical protein